MVNYLEFMNFIKGPPLLVIAEYALAAASSIQHFDLELGFEWLEERIIGMLHDNAEMERFEYDGEGILLPDHLPITRYIESLDHEPKHIEALVDLITETNKLFHYHYSTFPFPESLEDYDPFYECAVKLINPNTIVLEISDHVDIEQFNELYEFPISWHDRGTAPTGVLTNHSLSTG